MKSSGYLVLRFALKKTSYDTITRCECMKEVEDGAYFIFTSPGVYWMDW